MFDCFVHAVNILNPHIYFLFLLVSIDDTIVFDVLVSSEIRSF